jgi:hypothetical protein
MWISGRCGRGEPRSQSDTIPRWLARTRKPSHTLCSRTIIPDGAVPTLSDNDIEELVSFFQLLAEWDRQYKLNQPVQEDASNDGVPGELSK